MGETPLTVAEVVYIQGMGDIIESVGDFDGGKYSIAYNMYTFTETQYRHSEVVTLAVDGIAPTEANIFSEQYPITIYNYIYYDANNAPAALFAQTLHAYLMSHEGQQLINAEGYVNINHNFGRRVNESWGFMEAEYNIVKLYDPETGKFYDADFSEGYDRGKLLIFDSYADFVLRDGRHANHAGARSFLDRVFETNTPLDRSTVSYVEDTGVILTRGLTFDIWDVRDLFRYRYDGNYYTGLTYYIDEDVYSLGTMSDWMLVMFRDTMYMVDDAIADTGFISQIEMNISAEDIKRLYVRDFTLGDKVLEPSDYILFKEN
jgi:hypothetical protein